MTDRELLYIKTIAEMGNISLAAKQLYMTQPALSHCLGNLEREIGQPLFVRGAGGLEMTYAGECYYEMACQILDIYDSCRQKLMDIGQVKRGRIRMGMTRYISAMLIPEVLPVFSEKYPEIEICLKEMNSRDLEEETGAKKLDFAVVHREIPYEQNNRVNVEFHPICRDEFVVVAGRCMGLDQIAASLPEYQDPVVDLKDLEDYPVVLETRNHRMRYAVDGLFERAGIHPNLILETELFVTAQRLSLKGMGITLMNRQYTRFLNLEGCSVYSIPMKYKPYWDMGVVAPTQGYLSNASKRMIELIRQAAGELSL